MSGIYIWCKLVVYVSVISAIVTLIIPESGLKKVFQTLMTLMLIFSLMYPLNNNNGINTEKLNEIFKSYDESDFNSELYNYKNTPVIYSAQTEAEKYLNEKIKSSGIDGVCTVKCSVKDNTVYIDKVTVETHINENDKELLLSVIREICTNESVIIINGEKYERN